MELRQHAVAAVDGRRGPRQGFAPLGGPSLPLRKDAEGQLLRDGGPRKRRANCLQGLLSLGLPLAAPDAPPLVIPSDQGPEALAPHGRHLD
jgi:hypothetical protein